VQLPILPGAGIEFMPTDVIDLGARFDAGPSFAFGTGPVSGTATSFAMIAEAYAGVRF
jgi:hypothetical protein